MTGAGQCKMFGTAMTLPIDDAANEYPTRSPLGLLIGMALDQQMLEPGRITSSRLKER